MTRKDILSAAKLQMSLDLACSPRDFDKPENTVLIYRKLSGSSNLRDGGYFFKMITFGGGVCVAVDPSIKYWCDNFFSRKKGVNCFEFPALLEIDNFLRGYFHMLTVNTEMYLPDPEKIDSLPHPADKTAGYTFKWFEGSEISALYNDKRFENAMLYSQDPKRPDVLAAAAYDGEELMAIAGAGADSEKFWQIGVDVLPQYQVRSIGAQLVSMLTIEILNRGKIPYYGTWCGNMISRRLAQKCGYFPAWIEMHDVPQT